MPSTTIASATRIWNGPLGLPSAKDVERWAHIAATCSEQMFVSVDAAASACFGALFDELGVHQLFSPFWDGYSLTLNALVQRAAKSGHRYLFIQSVDIEASQQDIALLMSHMQEDTLVTGARLAPSHGGEPGIIPLNGHTSPWNTFAIWNIERLCLLGFQGVSDGLHPEMLAGVEEVPTIALHQLLFPDLSKAKLVPLGHHLRPNLWNGRDHAHFESKLECKNERASRQLAILGLNDGQVHVLPESAP